MNVDVQLNCIGKLFAERFYSLFLDHRVRVMTIGKCRDKDRKTRMVLLHDGFNGALSSLNTSGVTIQAYR
ncbi:hypothetical protein D3C77_772040 [compost metagenome]